MAAEREIPTVETLASESSFMVLDSAYRTVNTTEYPTDFYVRLNALPNNAKTFRHATLGWNMPFYGHNRESMYIRFRVDNAFPFPPTEYETWMTPYYVYSSVDGNDESQPTPYQPAVDGSYCADLKAALNNPKQIGGIFVNLGGQFDVRFSARTGIIIENQTNGFYIYEVESTWLQKANNTHGFGKLMQDGVYRLGYGSSTSVKILCSQSAPNLCPFRQISVSCDELTRHRRTPSFSNVPSAAFTSSEINVFPVTRDNLRAFKSYSNPSDPTIIATTQNDKVAYLRIQMIGDNGKPLVAQDVWPGALRYQNPNATFTDLATDDRTGIPYYGTMLENLYLQQNTFNTATGFYVKDNVACATDDLFHIGAYEVVI